MILRGPVLQTLGRRVAIFFVLSAIATILTLLFIYAVPSPVNLTSGLTTIHFAAIRSQLLPNDCVTFEWNVGNAQAVLFNAGNVANSGQSELCSYNDLTAELKVVSQDGSTHPYMLQVRMLLAKQSIFALFTLAFLILMFAFAVFIPAPLDYLLITLLALILAVPLFLLRGSPAFSNSLLQGAIWLIWLAVALLFIRRNRRPSPQTTAKETMTKDPASKASFPRIIAISGLLLIFTVIGYYIPLKQHFYTGQVDDAEELTSNGMPIWSQSYDASQGRPYSALADSFPHFLAPDHLDAYVWLALFEHFLEAVFIFALVRKFFPHSRSAVPLIAAILFVGWPAEIGRYVVVGWQNYPVSVCFLTFAIALYFHSFSNNRRWLLAAACLLLGIDLLIYETGFPLAMLALVLLWLLPRRRHAILWSYAWLATIGLLAIRLGMFLLAGSGSYQRTAASTGQGLARSLPSNFWNLSIAPLLSFLQYPGAVLTFGLYGLLAVVIVAGLLWRRGVASALPRRRYYVALLIAGVAILLATLPYYPINHYPGEYATQPLFRSQFYSTPIHAILWAVFIGLVGTWLSGRPRQIWLLVATASLVMLSVTGDLQLQANRGLFNPQITVAGLKQSLQEVKSQLPVLAPGSVILFTMDNDVDTPFGYADHLFYISCLEFGHPAYQGKFSSDGFIERSDDHPPDVGYRPGVYVFNQAIVFNVTMDWRISPASMPTITPSKGALTGSGDCASLGNGWPPVSTYNGPGLRYFQ